MVSRKRARSFDLDRPPSSDFLTRIDDLVTAENNRHDAMVTQLALLREHVLEGRIANKRPRIAGKENEGGHHSQQIAQVEQTESAPTLDQLANKMLLGQKLPCIKSIASRVAVQLLTRIIRDINSKGQAQIGWKDLMASTRLDRLLKG